MCIFINNGTLNVSGCAVCYKITERRENVRDKKRE